MVYRIWAECISDVYVDIEADSEEEAREAAEALDGGDFKVDPTGGDFNIGSVFEGDYSPDFNAKEILYPD